jgi:hypothetical protein
MEMNDAPSAGGRGVALGAVGQVCDLSAQVKDLRHTRRAVGQVCDLSAQVKDLRHTRRAVGQVSGLEGIFSKNGGNVPKVFRRTFTLRVLRGTV